MLSFNNKKIMTKSEIEANISHLHAHLAESADLSEADKVALRNGIGELEDKLTLLDFQNEGEDFDFGHHSEWE
ncbi:MAG: hypothetical protein CMP36_03980 [Rickettsiales bacterium]|nr:hypothetical protein [Rickettsiales bacterium]|tara:strand:+ start:484 stop:702 length:219 start_codon:yes stop_codon:yes gene_type:complete